MFETPQKRSLKKGEKWVQEELLGLVLESGGPKLFPWGNRAPK